MSDFLQKYALVAGTPVQIDSSKSSAIAYDFINNSPYDVDIAWGLNKSVSFSIPPTTIWRGASPLTALLISGNQWTGIIIATPSNPLGGTAPTNLSAAQLTVTGYAKGAEPTEQVTTLNTQTTIGGGALSQATQVIQTGQVVPTAVVSATPSPSFIGLTEEAVVNNDGSAHFGQISAHLFVSWDNNGNENVQSLTEFGGGIKGSAPVKLMSGNQETGYCSALQNNQNNTGTTGGPANFKTTMTNIPSSITITVSSSSNAPAPTAGNITLYGFSMFWVPTAAGTQTFVEATYVTVGN